MGFDLIGLNPTEKEGEYFHNNVWWWRPLAIFILRCCDSLFTEEEENRWHYNDCLVVKREKADRISEILNSALESGGVQEFETRYTSYQRTLPDVVCPVCNGSGSVEINGETLRCYECQGSGMTRPWQTCYPFSEDNVREFVRFCKASGGFQIC